MKIFNIWRFINRGTTVSSLPGNDEAWRQFGGKTACVGGGKAKIRWCKRVGVYWIKGTRKVCYSRVCWCWFSFVWIALHQLSITRERKENSHQEVHMPLVWVFSHVTRWQCIGPTWSGLKLHCTLRYILFKVISQERNLICCLNKAYCLSFVSR